MLRSTAALFLHDRTYERQKGSPIQEVVDFILDGPGVVLAEDGLLDVSGSALYLSERAGRAQAVHHLKARLEHETVPEIRAALSSCLRRHAVSEDNLADWWWRNFESSWSWLATASQIGVLGGLKKDREAQLAQLLSCHNSDSAWATQLLYEGGYDGTADDVLGKVKTEINQAAGEELHGVDATTPIGRLIISAAAVQLLPLSNGGGAGRSTNARTRLRGYKSSATVLSSVVALTSELRNRPTATTSESEWSQRLLRIAEVWGDGWVLRQAVAATPAGLNLSSMATSVGSARPQLRNALVVEAEARENRSITDWWREQLAAVTEPHEQRHWVFSVLTCAYSRVVIDLATPLTDQVDQLSAKHYRSVREAVRQLRKVAAIQELVLRDPLRLKQVTFSPRTLWLLRIVATEGSVEQIDKQLLESFLDLVGSGIGDLRELTKIVGSTKTIRFDSLRGLRHSLPVGGWASSIKLGAMRVKAADEILQNPAQWPGDLAQRAVQEVERRMLSGLRPMAEEAASSNWFAEA